MKVRERLYMMIMTKNWMNGESHMVSWVGSMIWKEEDMCVGVKIKVK